jgi:CheY-like chemotaxis protein
MAHLILIDDDPINNLICKRKLLKALPTLQISEYTSAKEGLAYFRHLTPPMPDVLLLDINMPGMNAWEFLDSFKNLNINLTVVIITSSIDQEDVDIAAQYPIIKQYFTKPLGEDKIQCIVDLFIK